MMKEDIFKDSKLNETFRDQGYVVLKLLSEHEINELTAFFNQQENELKNAFTTFATNNYNFKKQIDEKLKSVLADKFNRLFVKHKPFWGNIFTKHPGSEPMPLHADLQYVNESEEISFNVWSPLVNTNEENGAFGVVPGSQKVVNEIRGTNITRHYRENARFIRDAFGLLLPLKAGEAVVYDHRLLHYSLPNLSNESRLAITMVGVPENVQVIHYYAANESDNRILKYNINSVEDFYKAGFLKQFEHIEPVELIENHSFRELNVKDFEPHRTSGFIAVLKQKADRIFAKR